MRQPPSLSVRIFDRKASGTAFRKKLCPKALAQRRTSSGVRPLRIREFVAMALRKPRRMASPVRERKKPSIRKIPTRPWTNRSR